MSKLSGLPDIGKVPEKRLNNIGTNTQEDPKKIGSVDVCIKLKLSGEVCYNKEFRQKLKDEYDSK